MVLAWGSWATWEQRAKAIDPRVLDVALTLVLTGGCFATGAITLPGFRSFDALGTLLICLANLPVMWRGRFPLAALIMSSGVWSIYLVLHYPPIAAWAPMVALYSVTARCTLLLSTLSMLLGSLLVLVSAALVMPIISAIGQMVTVPIIWGFGLGRRKLIQVSAQLRIERENRAKRAVTEERVRIARELHDVVAHHMSVVSVQAGLARYVFSSDPELARTALDTISASSAEAHEEMRRMLIVLRAEDADPSYTPTPGLDRLGELADRLRLAGVPVEVTVDGTPRPLGSGADQCVFRIIQEALTNVLKHAGPATATVALTYSGDLLTVRVTDDGLLPAKPADEGSHGLLGMHEHARLYGGTLTAGPRPENGFEVLLTLPITSPQTRPVG